MSSTPQSAASVRQVAIDHHHTVVGTFQAYYDAMARDRFENAFTYGRHKIDVLLDQELDTLPEGARILDVGCGTGAYLRRYAQRGLVPVGVEPAEGMLEVARRDNPTLETIQGVTTDLPFPDASFDAVTAIEVLRYLHAEDGRRAIDEMLRVLKPGGFFFVSLVNRFALDGFFLLQRYRQARRGVSFDETHPHCEFTTPREIEAVARACGAHDVRTIGCLFAPVRLAYKANEHLGSRVARFIETADDAVHTSVTALKPFAGHLILVGRR